MGLRPQNMSGLLAQATRGPKAAPKKGAATDNLEAGILLLKKADTEPEIKDIREYPAWLTKLLMPRMRVGELVSMMSLQDQDFLELDHKDLKYLNKRSQKAIKKRRVALKKLKEDPMSDIELPGENFNRVRWHEVLLDSDNKKTKSGSKSEDDDEAEELDEEGEEEGAEEKKPAAGAAGDAAKKTAEKK